MLFRIICLLAVALPSSLTHAQSGDLPRLNKVEMQIVNMQVMIESQDERIEKNTAAIARLKSNSVGLSAPDPVRKLPPYGVTFSAPVVTYSTPVVVSGTCGYRLKACGYRFKAGSYVFEAHGHVQPACSGSPLYAVSSIDPNKTNIAGEMDRS